MSEGEGTQRRISTAELIQINRELAKREAEDGFLQSQISTLAGQVRDNGILLRGNGDPGVVEILGKVEQKVGQIGNGQERIEGRQWGVIASMLLLIAAEVILRITGY